MMRAIVDYGMVLAAPDLFWRHRCRASVPILGGWREAQCEWRAKAVRTMAPDNRELPVCGVHARPVVAYEYRPQDAYSSPVEAVIR